jgi:hypothetical protein
MDIQDLQEQMLIVELNNISFVNQLIKVLHYKNIRSWEITT